MMHQPNCRAVESHQPEASHQNWVRKKHRCSAVRWGNRIWAQSTRSVHIAEDRSEIGHSIGMLIGALKRLKSHNQHYQHSNILPKNVCKLVLNTRLQVWGNLTFYPIRKIEMLINCRFIYFFSGQNEKRIAKSIPVSVNRWTIYRIAVV